MSGVNPGAAPRASTTPSPRTDAPSFAASPTPGDPSAIPSIPFSPMHRTVTITIGGILFHVEDDAFTELDAYLSSIRKHFAAHADTEEIITDIENRIAEEF